jgi:hypothetical protein
VRRVLRDLHDLADLPTRVTGASTAVPPAAETRPAGSPQATAEREYRLAAYTTRLSDDPPGGDPGAAVLRHLTDQARTDALLNQFLATCPASSWPAEQGAAFARWFEDRRPTWDQRPTS